MADVETAHASDGDKYTEDVAMAQSDPVQEENGTAAAVDNDDDDEVETDIDEDEDDDNAVSGDEESFNSDTEDEAEDDKLTTAAGEVLTSPQKKLLAKQERARLREMKKRRKVEMEKLQGEMAKAAQSDEVRSLPAIVYVVLLISHQWMMKNEVKEITHFLTWISHYGLNSKYYIISLITVLCSCFLLNTRRRRKGRTD